MRYYSMIRSEDHRFSIRLDMVLYAKKHGIRAAARHYGTHRNTIRKWVRRYEQEGKAGLEELSRTPNSCPHQTPWQTERKIVEMRQQTGFSARRLKDECDINAGVDAINRVIRKHGLTRKSRRKPHRKSRDLRAQKMALQPMTHFQMDTKDLCDIPNYFSLMHHLGLPRYQFTIRDVCTGAQFLSFGSENTTHHAALIAKRFLEHLETNAVRLADVVIQTDNGSEYSGNRQDHSTTGFVHCIEQECGANHNYIPPGKPNYNADVESVHNTIESEFYDRERFVSPDDFLAAITRYQFYYNLARYNYSKGRKAPLDIVLERECGIHPRIFLLQPMVLGKPPKHRCETNPVGHDVPALAGILISFRISGRVLLMAGSVRWKYIRHSAVSHASVVSITSRSHSSE